MGYSPERLNHTFMKGREEYKVKEAHIISLSPGLSLTSHEYIFNTVVTSSSQVLRCLGPGFTVLALGPGFRPIIIITSSSKAPPYNMAGAYSQAGWDTHIHTHQPSLLKLTNLHEAPIYTRSPSSYSQLHLQAGSQG